MAYSAKETQKVLKMFKKGNRGEYIQVSRIIPENKERQESIDIRVMYTATDPNEGDTIRPTQKGVRINSETLPELIALICANMSEEEYIDLQTNLETLRNKSEEDEDEEEEEGFEVEV